MTLKICPKCGIKTGNTNRCTECSEPLSQKALLRDILNELEKLSENTK